MSTATPLAANDKAANAAPADALQAWARTDWPGHAAPSPEQTAAFERFSALGLPHRRMEGWRWTDMRGALRAYAPDASTGATAESAPAAVIEPSIFAGLDPIEVLIVDGVVDLSALPNDMPSGLSIEVGPSQSLGAEFDDHGLAALTEAMSDGAVRIIVATGAPVERPILIRHICAGTSPAVAQTVSSVGENASATIIETFEGAGAFYSYTHKIEAAASSAVRRLVWQDVSADTVFNGLCTIAIGAEAKFEQTALATGGKLSRQETVLFYEGAAIEAHLNSAALLSDARHVDFTSRIMHRAEKCVTRQQHKAAVRDRGRAVFQGKFYVARGAQQTDADMQANALLLSDAAEANHKPELEIYADDVECAHGSTAGALDEEALFYLRQRGLSADAARGLLIKAFVGEAIDGLEEGEAAVFQAEIDRWLAGAGARAE
ncbi:MAG: Fe-S cluster assembly protein SufD [Pseudomonadota bacterium]